MTTTLTHHHLTAEEVADAHGQGIMLTQQDGIDEPHTVLVHPWQLRTVCEQFGIIASDPQTAKTIATLTRRINLLRDRIDHLADWLANHSDSKHADLSYEKTYATATAEIANEFCADLIDSTPVTVNVDSKKPAATKLPASPQASLI